MSDPDNTRYDYDPDFRSQHHPKDRDKPFCCRCQRNVDLSKAVAVTINEEKFLMLVGHDRAEELRTNFTPHLKYLCDNAWIGKSCLAAVKREHRKLTGGKEGQE